MSTKILHALAASALLLSLACKQGKPASSRVIANVGGEKITELDFQDIVKTLSPDAQKVQAFLNDATPEARQERAQLVANLTMSRAILAYAKQTGLDQEPALKRQVEEQLAGLYFQALMKRRVTEVEPTVEQLQALYQAKIAEFKAKGQAQGLPPFEAVKDRLPQLWKQERLQALGLELQKDIKAKVPITLVDDYLPTGK